MIVLDTDIISLLDRKSGEGFERLVRRFTAVPDEERVCATIISFEEQMRGWLGQIAAARKPKDEVTAYTRLQRLLREYQLRDALRRWRRRSIQFIATPKNSHWHDGPTNWRNCFDA